jgi:hypothetical protein
MLSKARLLARRGESEQKSDMNFLVSTGGNKKYAKGNVNRQTPAKAQMIKHDRSDDSGLEKIGESKVSFLI